MQRCIYYQVWFLCFVSFVRHRVCNVVYQELQRSPITVIRHVIVTFVMGEKENLNDAINI